MQKAPIPSAPGTTRPLTEEAERTGPTRPAYAVITDMVAGAGADNVFTIAGTANYRLTAALQDAGLTIHAARHEGNAAAMALASARLGRRPGLLSVHAGPGLTNAATGNAEAARAGIPLLVLGGDTDPAAIGSNSWMHQQGFARAPD